MKEVLLAAKHRYEYEAIPFEVMISMPMELRPIGGTDVNICAHRTPNCPNANACDNLSSCFSQSFAGRPHSAAMSDREDTEMANGNDRGGSRSPARYDEPDIRTKYERQRISPSKE